MTDNDQFAECMKNSFAEIGIAPQYNTPAWHACQYVWDTAYSAGVQAERERCAVKAWSVGMDLAITAPNIRIDPREVGSKIAAAIRGQG